MPREIDRRAFLLASAALLTGCAQIPRSARHPPHRILVIGAGLAGLSCALDLKRLGHAVTVLEATATPGGRVLTVDTFQDNLHAEAGAELFYESDLAVKTWVSELGLLGERLAPPATLFLDGEFVSRDTDAPPVRLAWYLWEHLPEEAGRGPLGHLDHLSLLDLLESWRIPREVTGVINLLATAAFGVTMEHVSALLAVREVARRRQPSYHLRNGTATLVHAMTERLADELRLEAPVLAVEHNENAVAVHTHTGEMIAGHFAVISIPPPRFRRIEFDPPLGDEKIRAVEAVPLCPWVREMFQFPRRVWRDDHGTPGSVITDVPGLQITDATAERLAERGILSVDVCGEHGDSNVHDAAAIERLALDQMNRCWPGIAEEHERSVTQDWTRHPWIGGARSVWHSGGLLTHAATLARPVGRLHFTGEHTHSHPGSMEAALNSGRRAAHEIVETIGATRSIGI